MKKLRKISLEDFDRLSSSEASKLMGGYGGTLIGDTIPPTYKPVHFDPPAYNPPPSFKFTYPPGVGGTFYF